MKERRKKEKPQTPQYRRGPDGEPILPGFFDDYGLGGGGLTILNDPLKDKQRGDHESDT